MREMKEDLLKIIEELGFKPLPTNKMKVVGPDGSKKCEWYKAEIPIGEANDNHEIYLDATSNMWRLTLTHPSFVMEEDWIKDFEPTVANLIKLLIEFAFMQGSFHRLFKIRKELGI